MNSFFLLYFCFAREKRIIDYQNKYLLIHPFSFLSFISIYNMILLSHIVAYDYGSWYDTTNNIP